MRSLSSDEQTHLHSQRVLLQASATIRIRPSQQLRLAISEQAAVKPTRNPIIQNLAEPPSEQFLAPRQRAQVLALARKAAPQSAQALYRNSKPTNDGALELVNQFDALQREIDQLEHEAEQLRIRINAQQLRRTQGIGVHQRSTEAVQSHQALALDAQAQELRLTIAEQLQALLPSPSKALQALHIDTSPKLAQSMLASANNALAPASQQLVYLAYRLSQKAQWHALWQRLEAQQIEDKWAGTNSDQQRYFIYVGAFASIAAAKAHQQNLAERIEIAPLLLGPGLAVPLASALGGDELPVPVMRHCYRAMHAGPADIQAELVVSFANLWRSI